MIAAIFCAIGLAACDSNNSKNDENSEHEHVLVYHEANEPTCTEDGNIEYWTCSECGKLFSDAEGNKEILEESYYLLPATHKLVYHAPKIESCTEDGNKEYWECEACGKYFADEAGSLEISDKATVMITAHHNLNYISAKPASCTEDGNIEYWECVTCGMYFEDEACKKEIADKNSVILVGHHELNHYAAVQASCTEGGNIEYWQCKNCYAMFSDAEGKIAINTADTPALGHDMEWLEKAATCTQEGVVGHYHCTRCDKNYWDGNGDTEISLSDDLCIPAQGHDTQYVANHYATCTQNGNIEYWICSRCHGIFADSAAQTPISEEDIIIPAVGHNLTHYDAQESTCVEPGNIEYWYCSKCSGVFMDDEGETAIKGGAQNLPLKPHSFSAQWTSDELYHWHECSVCHLHEDQGSHSWNSAANSECTQCSYKLGYTYGLEFTLVDNSYYTVQVGHSLNTDIILIPSTYRGLPVEIADAAFLAVKNSVAEVIIEEGVTKIGRDAFAECNILRKVSLPQSMRHIGMSAFAGCIALDSIALPYGIITIEEQAFSGCSTLMEIIIPDSVNELGRSAFSDCIALKNITLGQGISSINAFTFSGCIKLSSIDIPDNIITINEKAFMDCSALTEVKFGSRLQEIGEVAFKNCTSIESIYIKDLANWCSVQFSAYSYPENEVSNPLKYANRLYVDGVEVTALTIPEGVSKINNYAFYGFEGITSVVIPNSVTEIGGEAFYGCIGLKSISVSAELQLGANNAFEGCDSIEKAIVPSVLLFGLPNTSLKNLVINGGEAITVYAGGPVLESVTISDSIQQINYANGAFRGSPMLKEVNIGNHIEIIGDASFAECNALTEIIIPDSVVSIGEIVFMDCESLKNVHFGIGLKTIDMSAFSGCKSLESITLPANLTEIGSYVFSECTSLKEAIIGVQNIGSYAFGNCASLEKVTLLPGVNSIGDGAFSGCSSLTSINIPASMKSIGTGAFKYSNNDKRCVYITDIASWCTIDFADEYANPASYALLYLNGKPVENLIIPDIEYIGQYAFKRCENIKSVSIPKSLKKIGEAAFESCPELKSVYINDIAAWCVIDFFDRNSNPLTSAYNLYLNDVLVVDLIIPDGVTTIGAYAFVNCSCIDSVKFPNGLEHIGAEAFHGCNLEQDVIIPNGIKTIGKQAFYGCNFKSIELGLSLETIGEEALAIRNLTYIKVNAQNEYYCSVDGVLFSKDMTQIVCYPCNKEGEYYCVPDSVELISPYAFSCVNVLKTIDCGKNVSRIMDGVFWGSSINSAIVHTSINVIDQGAFSINGSEIVIYYGGTSAQWDEISINEINNNQLQNATMYYYSKDNPYSTGVAFDEEFWHYAEDGKTPIVWSKKTI